jgi:protein SCO1/2
VSVARALLAALACATAVASLRAAALAAGEGPYALGDRVEASGLVTQDGRPFRFDDGSGRATALSFIYTACRDAGGCPTITARFVKLAERVDPRRVRLALVTIAPRTDTPVVLRRYASLFGPGALRLSLVTGDARTIAQLASRFAILGTERDPDGALDHAQRLVVLDAGARVADRIDGAVWSPDDAAAAVEAVAGLAHDPVRLFAVHLTWNVERTCGFPGTGAGTSLHHDAVALLMLLPPAPLAALLLHERRRRARRRLGTITTPDA